MLPETPLLYTFESAGQILGLSARTVRRLVERKKLRVIVLGTGSRTTSKRIPRTSIVDLLRASEPDTTDASDN